MELHSIHSTQYLPNTYSTVNTNIYLKYAFSQARGHCATLQTEDKISLKKLLNTIHAVHSP